MSTLRVMATTEEVTVSMGEVMVVKAKDEDECDDADKAQVILQLQPITVGYVTRLLLTQRPDVQDLDVPPENMR